MRATVKGSSPVVLTWDVDTAGCVTNPNANPLDITVGDLGTYDCTLIAENEFGSDSYDFTIKVEKMPKIVDVDIDYYSNGYAAQLTPVTEGDYLSYLWTFGDYASPNESEIEVPTVVLPDDEGTYSANLTIKNMFGTDSYDFNLVVDHDG